MTKKARVIILSVISVLLVVGVITAVTLVMADDLEYGSMVELITKENAVIHPESVVDIDINYPQNLDDSQKEQVMQQYIEKLDEVYSLRCQKRATYKNVMESKLTENNEYIRRDTIDSGVFEVNVISKEVENGIVKARLETVTWFKYISEPGENSSDKDFFVTFPVTMKTSDYEFEKTEDGWRILSCTACNDLPSVMGGDYDIEKSFDTYDEALEYANATTPKNVYATDE